MTWNCDGFIQNKLYLNELHKLTKFQTCMLQEINLDTAEASAHINSLNSELSMTANCHDKRSNFSNQMARRKWTAKISSDSGTYYEIFEGVYNSL